MTLLLLYAYCVGIVSSRKIERVCYEDLAFRVLTANQQPDHSRISEFRRRNLDALSNLFVQILRLCQKAGMVSLGHEALHDGTKVQANASKHKAKSAASAKQLSHERMLKAENQLEKEINALMRKAEILDAQEDRRYGKGNRRQMTCPMSCGDGRTTWPGSARPARRWKRRSLLLQRDSGSRRQRRPGLKLLPLGTRLHRQQSRPS